MFTQRPPSPSSRCRSASANGRSTSPPWVPPGLRPRTAPRLFATPLTGTRRSRSIEKSAVFLADPSLPPTDPNNHCWLYGSFDFKAHIPLQDAAAECCALIDRLVAKMATFNPPPPPAAFTASPQFRELPRPAQAKYMVSAGSDAAEGLQRRMRSAGLRETQLPSPIAMQNPAMNNGAPFVKGHLIFDIIATRKHIGPQPTRGIPYALGQQLYAYAELFHPSVIVTSFVGISDNTARRTGRDMYFSASDALSRNQIDFTFVDNQHMFIVYPETNSVRGDFPESIVAIRRRQEEEEERIRLALERQRQLEEERARLRPLFKIPHVEY